LKDTRSNPEIKKFAGTAAARLIEDGMVVGVGTGSTIAFLIEALGRRVREEGLRVVGVPTSFQSRLLCGKLGITVRDMQDCASLDLAIDGADEVDPRLDLIKGGGASHTREKVVAMIPSALAFVDRRLRDLGGAPSLRMAVAKDGPVVTDNGQFVVDVRFPPASDLRHTDLDLHRIPGVVETGLFFDLASKALVGGGSPGSPTLRTLTRTA